MKKALLTILTVGAAVFLVASSALAGEQQEQPQFSAEEMAAWQKASTPGPHHQHFAGMAGMWKTVNKVWMQPGTDPMITEMKAEYKVLSDGRFLHQTLEGEFMGMPFRGTGISGFDNIKGKHTIVWFDNMNTTIMYSEGDCAEHCMIETHYSSVTNAMTGEAEKTKTVSRIIDDNKHVFEYYMIGADGTEFKSMEITYTRM